MQYSPDEELLLFGILSLYLILKRIGIISCGASKLNTETGSPARPTIIVEKLTVKLDAQQLILFLRIHQPLKIKN